jgi:hypothetical protein
MRALLTGLMLLFALSAAQAQVRVERVDVLHRGIFKIGKMTTITDESISTGQRTSGSKITFVRSTDTIRMSDGVVFGLDVMIHGSPRGQSAPFRIIWRYPDPGLRNPSNNTVKHLDDYIDARTLDEKSTFYWQLGDLWTQVPGEWIFELWYGKRILLSESFRLVK